VSLRVDEEELNVMCQVTAELRHFMITLWNGVLRRLQLRVARFEVVLELNTLYEHDAVTRLADLVLDRAAALLRDVDETVCEISHRTEARMVGPDELEYT